MNNTTSTINPASLTLEAANVTKTFSGTLSVSDTASVASGTLYHNASNGGAQDSLSGGTFAYTDPNAGAGNKTVTTSGVTVNDGNGGGNYLISYVGNTTSTINPAELTFTGTVANKTYDGTTLAALTGDALTGFIGAQTVSANSGTATFATQNASGPQTVTIGGITLSNGTNGGLAANYAVLPTATAEATIYPKVLTVNAVVANKVYDGTTTASLSSYGLVGFVGNETVAGAYTGGATFADASVGTDKAVTISGITLTNGTHGGLATNYVVNPNGNSDANITPATLHVAGIVALNTVYNGTLAANVDTQAQVLTGVFGSDNVQVSSITGAYLTDGVGTNKPIVTNAFVLSGTNAADYVLVQPTGLSASITPRSLTVTAAGVNKVYDGTTAATVILTDNPVAGDVLSMTSTNAFLDSNAGTNKYISVSNIAISGADAVDYTVNGSTAAIANISPATLLVTASGVNRVYDGTTSAAVTLTDHPLPGDTVTLNYASAAFANKNVGTGKIINIDGINASGADARDYTISSTTTATANISPASLTVSTTGQNKLYDGSTAATVSLTDNVLSGDQVVLSHDPATFSSAAVGNGKTITVAGIEIAGGVDEGNYVLTNAVATTTGDITAATATLDAAYTAEQRVAGGWSLRPVVVALVPPTVPTAPLSLLDLALPAGFGGTPEMASLAGSMAGGPSDSASATADQATLLTVSVDRLATAETQGVVTVVVPAQIAAAGQGFSFSLPAAMTDAAESGNARATRMNGGALPAWLGYARDNKTFFVGAIPGGAFPIEVLVRIGTQRWSVRITQ